MSDPANDAPPVPPAPTAALLIVGDEILSGRTKDANLGYLGARLAALGVPLREVRVVPDIRAEIVAAVNALRARYTYLFTTGGIGPTHDDITAESVAAAFGVALRRHPEAVRRLEAHYADPADLNEARLRMANIPEGGTLIDNPVSAAPGFRIDNVFVMAGVPRIMQAMFEGVEGSLAGGRPVESRTIGCDLGEGVIAEGLGRIAQGFPDLSLGSYPWFRAGVFGTSLVVRGTDPARLEEAAAAIAALVTALGGRPVRTDPPRPKP